MHSKNKYTILIADDEQTNIEFVVSALKDEYQFKIAYDGETALKVLKKFPIDLVLLDIQMPKLNGYEVAGLIKKDKTTKDIPFMFLTSKDDSDSIVKGFELGAVDYLTKPFNKAELGVRVKNHIHASDQKRFIQTILDTQPNLILITDKKEALFVNQTLLEFYGCETLQEFKDKYHCTCNTFLHNDNYFHLGKVSAGEHWLDHLISMEPEHRIVSIVSKSNFEKKAFNVSIVKYYEDKYIITLTDISKTILRQLELEEKTIHDNLTGAYNREYIDINFNFLVEEARKEDKELGLAILDIDYFKKVNDTYGHDTGDETLITFVKTIQKHSRSTDKLIRWGGEEFLIILYIDSKLGFERALEHYRRVIEIQSFKDIKNITCSIGGTLLADNEQLQEALKRADEQLYLAKKNGRNQLMVAYKKQIIENEV